MATRDEFAPPVDAREAQAWAEVGHTEVGPALARFLVLALLATIALPPLGQAASDRLAPVLQAIRELPRIGAALRGEGLLAANRAFALTLQTVEDELERTSWLGTAVLPAAQVVQAALGVGNEQVWIGRGGWLFYTPDVAHLTGPAFLDPQVLRRRARSAAEWGDAPHPDPRPAIARLAGDLAARGVRLVVVPVPPKPALHPERLSERYAPDAPVVLNPSWAALRRATEEAGAVFVDLAPDLAAARAGGAPAFLATDTHWRPEAMAAAAARIAAAVRGEIASGAAAPGRWRRQPAVVAHRGDVAAMLRLPPHHRLLGPERVRIERVVDMAGLPWSPRPGAPVLLLGDSFANVFSIDALGWGGGAGLAEQLAYELQEDVDRIAINDGGAYTSRQRLRRELERDGGRLDGIRVVVWQFAARELTGGDWRVLPLP